MSKSPTRTDGRADAMRWVWRASALAVLLIGWLFILVKNNFHITPPVVFVGLGYFAGVASVYALFRTGAAAVARNDEDAGEATWGRPMGARGELEREKRTLLKAIKEAEFDHLMGKLSKRDADEMIATYRARAIEVIKELDRLPAGGTPREQIQREIRARLEVEVKPAKKPAARSGKKGKPPRTEASEAAVAGATASEATGDGKPRDADPAADPDADRHADAAAVAGASDHEHVAADPVVAVADEPSPDREEATP